MMLSDITNGPEGITWVVAVIFILLAIILLSGHGSMLIAGYNTMPREEREKYDSKKLCRLTGTVMLIIAIMILIMAAFSELLPAWTVYIFLAVTVISCATVIIFAPRICKKDKES